MKYLYILLICLQSTLHAGMDNLNPDFHELDKYPLGKMTKFYAEQLQAMMPLRIDEVTRTMAVVPTKNAMSYKKELDIDSPILAHVWGTQREQSIKELYAMELDNTCGAPIYRYLIVKRGMRIVYNYYDTKHNHLFRYTVETEDCLKYELQRNSQ